MATDGRIWREGVSPEQLTISSVYTENIINESFAWFPYFLMFTDFCMPLKGASAQRGARRVELIN